MKSNVKRNAPEELKGLSSLSLINPWHVAMKVFDSTAAAFGDGDVEEEPELTVDPDIELLQERLDARSKVRYFFMRNMFPTI